MKLKIDVLTIFPKMFDGVFTESLLGKAQAKKLVNFRVHDIRNFSTDRHRSVDDRPYGGGAGMVMMAEPIYKAIKSLGAGATIVYLSPQGKPFTQKLANSLAKKKHLILLCGHYEGIDERLFDYIDLEVSVGDVVLTGGEIPAMVVADAVARQIPGVVKEADSLHWDSFAAGWNGLLDCAHYTRPAVWRKKSVPPVLLQGHHQKIQAWRQKQSLENTRRKRPDILKTKARNESVP